MAVFGDQITKQQVQYRAAQILTSLRDTLGQAVSFNSWLSALADSDLTNLGFTAGDITTLRGAFADLATLNSIVYGGPLPAAAQDYSAHGKLIIGPQ